MLSPYILKMLLLSSVLVAEFAIMRYYYKKPSALERLILTRSASGRTDSIFFFFRWLPFGYYRVLFTQLIAVTGVVFLAVRWLQGRIEFPGLIPMDVNTDGILAILAFYILFDLGDYISHRLLHQVPLFWRFHKLHHSAMEFNIITGTRVAFIEAGFKLTFNFTLLTVLVGMPRPEIAAGIVMVRQIIDMIQHSDLPWHFGPLGTVFVGPRYHRMHHSHVPEDYDTNFGNLLTIWDTMFGTTSARYKAEGPAIADTVPLGLSTDDENARYNRWWYALWHETIPHYLWESAKYLRRRFHGQQAQSQATGPALGRQELPSASSIKAMPIPPTHRPDS